LRAFAAYAVVAFHVFEFLHADPGFGVGRFEVGKAGVDLFFVLSGFIMVYTTAADESPARFITKRAARIVPLYWAATALAVLVAFVRPWLLPQADLSFAAIVKSFAFIPAPDLSGTLQPVLFVGWTLNFEMMFYALFALTLFLPARHRTRRLIGALIATFLLAGIFGPGTAAAFYGQPILLDFGIGCLIAKALPLPQVARAARRVPLWPALPAATLVFAVAAQGDLPHTGPRTRPPGARRFQLFGLPAAPVPGAGDRGHGGETVRRHAARRRHHARHLLRCHSRGRHPILPALRTPFEPPAAARPPAPAIGLTLRPARQPMQQPAACRVRPFQRGSCPPPWTHKAPGRRGSAGPKASRLPAPRTSQG